MKPNTYKMLRAFCVQDIGEHIPKLAEIENNPGLAKKIDVEKLSSSEVALVLDNAVAHDLLGLSDDSIRAHQSDLTPRQLAAAKLLKVSSGVRLIAINHEKYGVDGGADEVAQKATDAVREAVEMLSSFLSKKDSAVLMTLAPKPTSDATEGDHGGGRSEDSQLLEIARNFKDRNIRSEKTLSQARRWRELYLKHKKRLSEHGKPTQDEVLSAVREELSGDCGWNDSPPEKSTIIKSIRALEKLEKELVSST